MSTIDKRPMPSQLWYNSLRNSDTGSLGRYDQSEKLEEDVRFNYLRSKVFTPTADSIREEFAIASQGKKLRPDLKRHLRRSGALSSI